MSERRPWTLRKVLAVVAVRFREGAAAVPERVWRRWFAILAAGYVGVLLVATGLVRFGRALTATGRLAWEADFLRGLDAMLPLSFSSAVWIQSLGTDITLVLFVAFTAGLAVWTYRPIHALTIAGAYVGLDLVVRLAWSMWHRARPDVIMDGIAAPGFASFPSGHTAKSLAVYGLLALFWARSTPSHGERLLAVALALLAVLLVAVGRLRMGVHWPSDVAAGALLGGVWLAALALALDRAEHAAALERAASVDSARG